MEWLTQNRLRNLLLLITLAMTAKFGFGLASGITGMMFAVVLVAVQAAALLHLPAKVREAKDNGSDLAVLLYGGSIALALLVSVVASVATLSAAEDSALQDLKEREVLEQAIAGYMDAGYITRALETKAELDALPVVLPSGLQSAAMRLETVTGVDGMMTISVFVILLALMLDGYVLVLGNSHGVTPRHDSVVTEPLPVVMSQAQMDFGESQQYDVTVEHKAGWPPEVHIVIKAHQSGELPKLTVNGVREYLGCAQEKARQVAKICKTELLVA